MPIEQNKEIFDSLPTITESEQEIAKKAGRALSTLKSQDAMDLAEMLGLTPYLEETHA